MTAFPRLHGDRLLPVSAVSSASAALRFLLVPAIVGWLLFVTLDVYPGLLPQEIRISHSATADGAAWAEYDPYMDDFVVFYAAGNLARTEGSGAYDVTRIHREQSRLLATDSSEIIRLPFFNPPQYIAPLAALSRLGMGPAALVWTVGGLMLFGASVALLFRNLQGPGWLVALSASGLVVSMPFHEVILHGQMTFMLFAGLVTVYLGAVKDERPWVTALGLTLLAVKPQLVAVPIVYLLVSKQFGSLWMFAAVQAGLSVVAVAAYGIDIFGHWIALVVSAVSWEDTNGVWIHAMFGWNAFVRAAVGPDHSFLRSVLTAGLSAATLTIAIALWRKRSAVLNEQVFAALVFAGLLLSPHLFAQDLLLAGVALLPLIAAGSSKARSIWMAFGAVGWALTFWHFSYLLPGPTEHGLNFVTLWLATGLLMASAPLLQGWNWRGQSNSTRRGAEEVA